MKQYGDTNFQGNNALNMGLGIDTQLPANPAVGRIAFTGGVVYICAAINSGQPLWIPMTNTITAYTQIQTDPSSVWSICHDLNTITPAVQMYDNNNQMFYPDNVQIVDSNNIIVTLANAIVGRCVVLSGTTVGVSPASIGNTTYVYNQVTAASTWTISHNLGQFPLVRVFVNNQEIQPQTITFTSINQVTITFSSPQVGMARLTTAS